MKKKIEFWLGVHVMWWVALVVFRTLRVRFIHRDVIEKLRQQKQNYVLAFWHGTMLLPWFLHRRQNMQALISLSEDGEILARTLQHWGYEVIRGSSSMGGKEAMQLMTDAVQAGASLCVTPDGPRGPRHRMKMGAVRVAQKALVPLVLLSVHIKKKRVMRNWDQFEIPFPFSRVVAMYGGPIWVDARLEGEPLDRFLSQAEGMLLKQDRAAESALGSGKTSPTLDKHLLETVAGVLLFPISLLYSAFIRLRNNLFDYRILRIHEVGVPVVSVGDMTTGGTGKTPVVEYATKYFLERGKKVAVISRGYKRITDGMVVVSDGSKLLVSARASGDEPYQIARKFREAVVIVDRKRVRAAKYAVERLGAEIIILDDGFQHRYLHRDRDIVVIDSHRLPMDMRHLPAGRRREAPRGLSRADVLIVSKLDDDLDFDAIASRLRRFTSAPVVACRYSVISFKQAKTQSIVSLESLRGKTALAFCGIGNSASFYETLRELQLQLLHTIDFADHHYYTDADVAAITNKFDVFRPDYVVTTEKDYARLLSGNYLVEVFFEKYPVHYLQVEVGLVVNENTLKATLDSILSKTE